MPDILVLSSQIAQEDSSIDEYEKTLQKHLSFYQREDTTISVWDHTKIPAGSTRLAEIQHALQSAKVAVLLVNIDFLTSDLICNEVQPQLLAAARQKKITIICVILNHCSFKKSDLARFDPVNDPSHPLIGMKIVEQNALWERVANQACQIVTEHTDIASFKDQFNHRPNLEMVTEYLLHCRSVKDTNLREQIFSQLSKMIPAIEAASIASRNDRSTDSEKALRLVETCSFDPQGLEKLAYVLYQLEGASPQWTVLDNYVRELSAKMITYTRQQQLYALLTQATWPTHILKSAYRTSVPAGWEMLQEYNVPDMLLAIIEDLVKIPSQNDDTFPLLEFVQYLAYSAKELLNVSLHDALKNWISERFKDLDIQLHTLAILQEKVKKNLKPASPYLLITLEEANENTCCVQAYLLDDDSNPITPNVDIDEQVALTAMPAFLDDLLEKCSLSLSSEEMNSLVIEFFLPQTLLSYPVDRWSIDMGMTREAVGQCYQVVIRSLDRARKRKIRPRWENKWGIYQKLADNIQRPAYDKNAALIYNEGQHQTQQGLSAALLEPFVVCLAFTFVPQDVPSHPGYIFNAALGSGVPIILWPRKYTNHPATVYDMLTTLLTQQPLSQLSKLVQNQRIEATKSEDENHQGHHITLLWDDPNRLPPTMKIPNQMAMPATRKRV